jgi:hypothetical protein
MEKIHEKFMIKEQLKEFRKMQKRHQKERENLELKFHSQREQLRVNFEVENFFHFFKNLKNKNE